MRWPLGHNYQYALTLQNNVYYLFITEMIFCIPGITRKDLSTSLDKLLIKWAVSSESFGTLHKVQKMEKRTVAFIERPGGAGGINAGKSHKREEMASQPTIMRAMRSDHCLDF